MFLDGARLRGVLRLSGCADCEEVSWETDSDCTAFFGFPRDWRRPPAGFVDGLPAPEGIVIRDGLKNMQPVLMVKSRKSRIDS